jgi:hypothetical protein
MDRARGADRGRRGRAWPWAALGLLLAVGCASPAEFSADPNRLVTLRRADADGPASITVAGGAPREPRGQFVVAVLPIPVQALLLPVGAESLDLPEAFAENGRPLPRPVAVYEDLAAPPLPALPAWVEALRLPPFSSAECHARAGCAQLVEAASRANVEAETPICQLPCAEPSSVRVPAVDDVMIDAPEAPSVLDCGPLRAPRAREVAGTPLSRCGPPERAPEEPCPPGARRIPNSGGRCATGPTCAADDWPALPDDGATAWVDPAAVAPGDGTRARPYPELRAALARAEVTRVGLRGRLRAAQPIRVERSVELVGACPSAARLEGALLVAAGRPEVRGLALVGSIEVAPSAGVRVSGAEWVGGGPIALTVGEGASATIAASRLTLTGTATLVWVPAGAGVHLDDAELRGSAGARLGRTAGDLRIRRTRIDGLGGLAASTPARLELEDVEWHAGAAQALSLSRATLGATRLRLEADAPAAPAGPEVPGGGPDLLEVEGGAASLVEVVLRAGARRALSARGGVVEVRDAWVGASGAPAIDVERTTLTLERVDLEADGGAALAADGADLALTDVLFARADEADDARAAQDRAAVVELDGGKLRAARTAAQGARHHTWSLRGVVDAALSDLLVEDRRGARALDVELPPPAALWVESSSAAAALVITRAVVVGGFDGLSVRARGGSVRLEDVAVGPSALEGTPTFDARLRPRGVRVEATRLEVERLSVRGRPEFGISAGLIEPGASASLRGLRVHELRERTASEVPCESPEPSNAIELTHFDPSAVVDGERWSIQGVDGRGIDVRGRGKTRVRSLTLQDVRCRAVESRDRAELTLEDVLVRRGDVGQEGDADELLSAVNEARLVARRVDVLAPGATALARFTDLASIVVEEFSSVDVPIGLLDDDLTQLIRPLPERALRAGRLAGASVGLTFKSPPSPEICARFERRPVLQGVILAPGARPIIGCEAP